MTFGLLLHGQWCLSRTSWFLWSYWLLGNLNIGTITRVISKGEWSSYDLLGFFTENVPKTTSSLSHIYYTFFSFNIVVLLSNAHTYMYVCRMYILLIYYTCPLFFLCSIVGSLVHILWVDSNKIGTFQTILIVS